MDMSSSPSSNFPRLKTSEEQQSRHQHQLHRYSILLSHKRRENLIISVNSDKRKNPGAFGVRKGKLSRCAGYLSTAANSPKEKMALEKGMRKENKKKLHAIPLLALSKTHSGRLAMWATGVVRSFSLISSASFSSFPFSFRSLLLLRVLCRSPELFVSWELAELCGRAVKAPVAVGGGFSSVERASFGTASNFGEFIHLFYFEQYLW